MISIEIKGLNNLRRLSKNLSSNLQNNVIEGIYTSAYQIQDIWREKAIEVNMPNEYVESIDVITRTDGSYVGPSKLLAITPTGIVEFEKARAGQVISAVVPCPIHKYYREVKRKYKKEEVQRYQLPDIVNQNLPLFKEIIKGNIKENILSLLR